MTQPHTRSTDAGARASDGSKRVCRRCKGKRRVTYYNIITAKTVNIPCCDCALEDYRREVGDG